MNMKKSLLLITALFALAMYANQPKQVYITLDVSGSMYGDKYNLANYTTQMIVALCDADDEVNMIVYGETECLSNKSNPLAAIQKTIAESKYGKPESDSQFDDIEEFNKVYKAADDKENWLFVVGDGVWGTGGNEYKKGREKFSEIIGGGTLNVCYLQTGESLTEDNDFTQFARTFGVIDIRKSDTHASTIIEGCNYFARKILGFSEVSLKVKKVGEKRIYVKSEMPLKGFYLVYQDEVEPDELPKICDVKANGSTLNASLKGTPTTIPLKNKNNEASLSGHVYHVQGAISSQTEIEVGFDKNVDPAKICIYPIVEDMEWNGVTIDIHNRTLKKLDSRTFSICREESKAQVKIELSGDSKKNLSEGLLQKTKVVVKANNKDYPTHYNNGSFECEIDLIDEETPYYAECDCPGYFKHTTPITKIIKGGCPPDSLPDDIRPVADMGSFTFEQLKIEDITFTISDSLTQEALDPNLFDITFDLDDDFLYEEPKIRIENGVIHLELHPKGEWCECLFPEGLNITMISTPKEDAFQEYGKNYKKTIFPFHAEVIKDRPWLTRCFWVIVTLVALLLFMIYLKLLLKKKRFKKCAMVTPRYYSYYGDLIDDQGGRKLRKEGFGAWFSRWFLPGDERTTVFIDRPDVGSMTFIASESKEVVRIPKSCCDFETMDISGYDPETDMSKSKTVTLGDMGTIEVTRPNGSSDGDILFTSGSENNGAGHKMFLGLLMIISILTSLVLLWLMIRSL